MIISGLILLLEACDQQAQHPAVVVLPPGAEVLPPVAKVKPPVAEIQNVRHPVQNKNKHKKWVEKWDNCPSPNNVSYHLFPKCEKLKSEWKKICSKTYMLRNAMKDETSGTIHMLVFFFYYVLIKYKNNFTLLLIY